MTCKRDFFVIIFDIFQTINICNITSETVIIRNDRYEYKITKIE